MSSAYSAALTPLGDSDTRSLMNNRKRVGDRKSHWGTPWRRKIFLLLSWSRLTRARLLNRYDWIHLSMLLATPFLVSLVMSPSIHTLSTARCRSIQATRVTFFSCNASSISYAKYVVWSSVERNCRRPACSGAKRSLVSRYHLRRWLTTLSIVFPTQLMRLMGR